MCKLSKLSAVVRICPGAGSGAATSRTKNSEQINSRCGSLKRHFSSAKDQFHPALNAVLKRHFARMQRLVAPVVHFNPIPVQVLEVDLTHPVGPSGDLVIAFEAAIFHLHLIQSRHKVG
jgi:hypothetical protein